MTQKTLALNKYKEEIKNFLDDFLSKQEKNIAKISLDDKVFHTLKNFLWRGKMARANLLILTYEIMQDNLVDKSSKNVLSLASALELIQAGLLIHDDIIDQDQQRRGQDSIWHYYASQNSQYNQHYGQSQAICVADLAFFMANQLIAQTRLSNQQSFTIQQLINREISQVILAEMLDAQLALNEQTPSLEQIMEMNLYKTARYTFSLPLILAAHLAKQSPALINDLSQIGEKIGLIYQMQDDYLGIFGDSKKTGKPILSDIKEGKKTIFYYYLINNKQLVSKEKKLLNSCFTSKKISQKNSEALKKLFKNYSLQAVTQQIKKIEREALDLIKSLNNEKLEKLLKEILNFAQDRQH
jgi:geranylgeranyl diphosphate synthase type I